MWETILLSALAGLMTLVGILLVRLWQARALQYSHYVNSFAAGLILAAALVVLLPEAASSIHESANLYAVGGFALLLVVETLLVFHSGAEVHYDRRTVRGMMFFWGLFLHSFLDGIVLAVGFATGAHVGAITALAVVSHELPEGITTFSLLLEKLKRRTALALSVAVALATPVGAIIGLAVWPVLPPGFLGVTLAVVAGSFIYLAAADIVPEMREQGSARWNAAFLLCGMAFLIVVFHLLGD